MPCDLCGNSKVEFVCAIEGSEVTVCSNCSKYGEVIRRTRVEGKPQLRRTVQKAPERIEEIVGNAAELIRKKRESLKMTQEEFAKKIQEKETTLHKWETGHLKPDFQTAKKLERMLGIKLITVLSAESQNQGKKESAGLTIGDILKIS